MELPKNITQIGESDRRCKIYVEDYVISYMKQLNQMARDKDMAVALFGVRKEENDVSYLFLYGACKLNFLQREVRHLSQAQQQEIERCRVKYFPEHSFLGYRLLNGEMIEGIHVCEQGICRYISGYAQFYEKNDSMLAYMLDVREEAPVEEVNQEKYEVARKKQEERRLLHEESRYQKQVPVSASGSLHGMRVAVVAVFAFLCIVGLSTMNGNGQLDLQAMARQVLGDAGEQKIPDAQSDIEGMEATNQSMDTLIAEDKLAEAVLQENAAPAVEPVSAPGVAEMLGESEGTQPTEEAVNILEQETDVVVPEEVPVAEVMVSTETVEESFAEQAPVEEPVKSPTSYIIKEGDTLIGISVRSYGSDGKVSEICALNQIRNPDDIKVGQKILLP